MPRGRKPGTTFQVVRRPAGEEMALLRARIPESQKAWLREHDPLGAGNISRALQRLIKHAIWEEQERKPSKS